MDKLDDLKKYRDKILSYFPKSYKGACGHVMCQAIRDAKGDIDQAFLIIQKNIEKYGHYGGTWEYIKGVSPQEIKNAFTYYAAYESLSQSEKRSLKSGGKKTPLPQPPSTTATVEEWEAYYDELKQIQKVRNYKKGWLYYQLKYNKAPDFLLDNERFSHL
jgi:hypothetical protein